MGSDTWSHSIPQSKLLRYINNFEAVSKQTVVAAGPSISSASNSRNFSQQKYTSGLPLWKSLQYLLPELFSNNMEACLLKVITSLSTQHIPCNIIAKLYCHNGCWVMCSASWQLGGVHWIQDMIHWEEWSGYRYGRWYDHAAEMNSAHITTHIWTKSKDPVSG